MAVHRDIPKCPFCGAVIAKGVYANRKNFIGDTFIRWEYIKHECDKMKRFQRQNSNNKFIPNK